MSKTYFENIEQEIVQMIEASTKSIFGLIAWLTNYNILNALSKALKNGSKVKIILSNSEWNLISKSKINDLLFLGAEFKTIGANDTNNLNSFMHLKLCVIDEKYVLNGSFNWTKKASINHEGYTINSDEVDALNCINQFDRFWGKSKTLDWSSIENEAKFSIEILKELEDQGQAPEELILLTVKDIEKLESNIYKTNNNNMELAKIQNNELILDTTNFSTKNNYDFNYEKDLDIFGVDYIDDFDKYGIWYKFRLKIDGIVHNVAIEKIDLLEVLKNNEIYSSYWFKNYQIPLSLLNCSDGRLRLLKPIKFIKLVKDEERYTINDSLIDNPNSRCNYKLCIEIGNIMYLKTERIYTNSNIHKYIPVENDHIIK